MPVTAILGCQWGDEGKGKIVDGLTEKATMVVRFQGGNNAGHTIYTQGHRLVLHQVPSGVLHPQTQVVIGNGVVINPKVLLKELAELEKRGIDCQGRLVISGAAHIILPFHIALDAAQEEHLTKTKTGKIGTTGRGVGPCYQAKFARIGLRFMDFLDLAYFEAKFAASVDYYLAQLRALEYSGPAFDAKLILSDLVAELKQLKPYIQDSNQVIQAHLASKGAEILLEGAQGTFLDIDHGTYPFVTSSNTTIGGAITGTGLSPKKISKVVGVVKSYTTRVGEGPFPTELLDATGVMLRDLGHEYGATTGRPRRCGWFDANQVRHAIELNGVDSLALTKLDVLDHFHEMQICTGYKQNGRIGWGTPDQELTPIYETWPGWTKKTAGVESWADLPTEAQDFIKRLESLVGAPMNIVSTGPLRQNTIYR